MALSSNSVIHFTNKFESIKGIIQTSGFNLKYCIENILIDDFRLDMASPMVCFCDIPLSEVKNHINSYGSYGIGLYKSWAKQKGLNPVLYIENKSENSKVIKDSFKRLIEINKQDNDDMLLKTGFIRISQYFKNYEGHLKHGIIDNENYRFYDEREWRYLVPLEKLNGNLPIISAKAYLEKKEEFNNKIQLQKLEFEIEDISYIIVDNEDEIPELLNVLNVCFEDKYTAKQLKVLTTKVLTKNQIFNDF